jgi:FG-GAP-like repeat
VLCRNLRGGRWCIYDGMHESPVGWRAAKLVPVLTVALLLASGSQGDAQSPLLAPAEISPFDVGAASGQVLLADIDHDGDLDLVTRHQRARAIKIHLGDGQANFTTTQAVVALSFAPGDMQLGDVNGDRILDVVVTATDRDVVDVLLGDARAVFRRAGGSPFAVTKRVYRYNKRSLHLVDVNEDGHLDIVTANRRGQFAFPVLLGNGRGRFARGPVLGVEPAQEGYTLAFGDVDGDGHIDAVTAVSSPEAGRLEVRSGNGRGMFRRPRRPAISLPAPYRVEAVADVNSDRRPDVVLTHRRAVVSVLLSRGRGRLAPAAGSPFTLSSRPFAVVPADLDRDGRIDLVGATVNSVTVLLGHGDAFPRARQASFRAGPGAYSLAVGDLNGDGRPDVVAASFESTAVTVLVGR